MIKTIVFDVGNVIWDYEVPCQRFHVNLAKFLNITPATYRREYEKVYQDFETDQLRLLSWCRTFNPNVSQKQLDDILSKFLSPTIYKKYLNRDVVNLIKKLKPYYSLGYLSNGENYYIPYIYRPLNHLFQFHIISCLVGIRKPAPLIYQEIFKYVNCHPNEVIFIDDKPENIAGAKDLGINALLFIGYSQLFSDLSQYLPKEIISTLPAPTVHTK
ncbi:MAG: HAD-IA family hydrolase [Candidatus Shapirobacteria bacterium]|jgi:FMN phosphatase YigB (HAD superfamily)